MAVNMKTAIFWDVTPSILVGYQFSEEAATSILRTEEKDLGFSHR
jgi:hypothetical protein